MKWYSRYQEAIGRPIEKVRFSTRIRNALTAAGWKTVGEIREASDETLLGGGNCPALVDGYGPIPASVAITLSY